VFAVAADGTVWIARGRELWRWATEAAEATQVATTAQDSARLIRSDGGVAAHLVDGSVWRPDPDGTQTQMLSPAQRNVVSFDEQLAVLVRNRAPHHLPRIRPAPRSPAGRRGTADRAPRPERRGRPLGADAPARVRRQRPGDPDGFARWLADATNAAIAPGTDALVWK